MPKPLSPRRRGRHVVIGLGAAALGAAALPAMASAALVSTPSGTSDLGEVLAGSSTPVPFTLTNTAPPTGPGGVLGNILVITTAPALSGSSASEFTLDPGTCTVDRVLGDPTATQNGIPLSYSCAGTLTFKPTSPGKKSVTVSTVGGMQIAADGCTASSGALPFSCSNSFTVTANVGKPAELAPTLKVVPGQVRNYRTVTASVTTRNNGDFTAKGARSCVQMPTGFVVLNRRGALRQGNLLCWKLGDLAGGATSTRSAVLLATSAKRRPTVRVFQGRALFTGTAAVKAKSQRVLVSGAR